MLWLSLIFILLIPFSIILYAIYLVLGKYFREKKIIKKKDYIDLLESELNRIKND